MPETDPKSAPAAGRATSPVEGGNGERVREGDAWKRSPEDLDWTPNAPRRASPPEAFGRGERARVEPPNEEHEHQEEEGHEDQEQAEEPAKPPFYKRPVLMTVLVVLVLALVTGGVLYWLHARQFEKTDDAFVTGHIVRIAPRVAGQVTRVLVDDNQVVRRGDLLAELDPTDLAARVTQSEADLRAAEGRLAEAEAQVTMGEAQVGQARAAESAAATEAERAATDLKRDESLDPRAISQQQLDAARAAARAAAANLNAAKQKTMAAQSQLELNKAQVGTAQSGVAEARAVLGQNRTFLGYTRITAPEDGRVTNKTVEAGAYVQTGQALLSIVPRNVWVVANFKETQITNMRVGQPVTVEVDAYPHKEFHAHVDSFQAGTGAAFSLLPPENATGNYVKVVQRVPVKIVFDDPPDDRYLLGPGMSVTPKVKVR